MLNPLEIKSCTPDHFNWIHSNLELFWGSNRTKFIHHPLFIHEFGNTSFVIEAEQYLIGYLFGFFSQKDDYGYIHAVGVHVDHQHQGIGTALYQHFIKICREAGQKKIKAITTPQNKGSIDFHLMNGFHLVGNVEKEGLLIAENYAGMNEDRVIMIKEL